MTRYAIYAVPGAAAQAGFNEPPTNVALGNAARDWFARPEFHHVTTNARRYGFHATLKAPFHLADGVTGDALSGFARKFAAHTAPVVVPSLQLRRLGGAGDSDLGFRALVPTRDCPAVGQLAARIVTQFDPMRAPLTNEEYDRRKPEHLDEQQRDHLRRWGYPHVLDRFRFHFTLTDALSGDGSIGQGTAEVDAALASQFAQVLGSDLELVALCICVEPEPGATFELHSIHPLEGSPVSRQDHSHHDLQAMGE